MRSRRFNPTAGNVSPGGIAEIDERGRLVRSRSAADASADQTTLRASVEHEHNGNQVQVYRLSDLSLIKTIRLPGNEGPNEPRMLGDGRTVLVATVECRLYQVTGLEGVDPQLKMVHQEASRGCAMPVVIGGYWVQAHAADHRVFSLDIRDLDQVRAVSSVSFDERQRPHWLATDGARIVVVNEPAPAAERRMWMLSFDRATGTVALDRVP
jgi:hypothetical protein